MKSSKTILAIILGAILITGIACGGQSASPTPTPTPTATHTPTPTPIPAKTTVNVNASDSGGRVNISVGNLLIVTLDSNATTGYSWNLSAISNTSVIAKVSDEYATPTPTNPPLMGQGGQEVWTFEALAAGTANITMKYIRPWESEAEPAANFSITVNVK
jgi:inhibitor of cysteine peptidase